MKLSIALTIVAIWISQSIACPYLKRRRLENEEMIDAAEHDMNHRELQRGGRGGRGGRRSGGRGGRGGRGGNRSSGGGT